MSKKDRIFRVLSIVLLMTMLLFSFVQDRNLCPRSIHRLFLQMCLMCLRTRAYLPQKQREQVRKRQVLTRSHPPLIQRVPLPRRQV